MMQYDRRYVEQLKEQEIEDYKKNQPSTWEKYLLIIIFILLLICSFILVNYA